MNHSALSSSPLIPRSIKRLPVKTVDGIKREVDVHVVPMSADILSRWCSEVQPLIDTNYRHADAVHAADRIRADVHWDWRRICRDAFLHTYAGVFGLSPHGHAVALAIVVTDEADNPFPIGMLTTVPQFRCRISGVTEDRGFTWYLTSAPTEVYDVVLNIPEVRGVGRMLLDTSIQVSIQLGLSPAHLLHADPRGGPELSKFYTKRCMMRQLTDKCGPITNYWRRRRSEEYYQFNSDEALIFCSAFDTQRSLT